MSRVLVLDARLHRTLNAWAEQAYPREACGLLVGRRAGQHDRVLRVEPARNLESEHASRRFTLAPEDLVRVEAAARAEGLRLLGVWHSHPDHPASPSAADLRHAWKDTCYLITTVSACGAGEQRAWVLVNGAFVEQAVVSARSDGAGPTGAGARRPRARSSPRP